MNYQIEFKVDEIGYTFMKIVNSTQSSFSKEIEHDIDGTTYFHVSTPLKDSVWKMLTNQANRSFALISIQCHPDIYESQKHMLPHQPDTYYLELIKDYEGKKIIIVIRLPTCDAAFQYFLNKEIDTMNCMEMIQTLVKHVATSMSINESYVPGTLLGNYT